VYGYDEISSSFHYGGLYDLAEVDSEDVLSSIAKTMSGLGFRQCYLNSLTDEKTSILLGAHSVAMQNPLSSSMSHLRTSLFPGLLETLNYNIRNGASNVNLFEIGKEYRPGKMYDEVVHLTGVMHGEWLSKSVHNDDQHHSIYSLKGIINALFNRLNMNNISFLILDDDLYEYGLSIKFGKTIIGHCGKMSQSFLEILNLDIDDVYGFDIELDSITSAMKIITNYESIVHYPKVDRDINFVLEDEIHSGDVVNAIMKACSEYLIAVQPVNIYQHVSLGDNKKSVTFHLEFQSVVKTLEEAEINSAMNDITAIITKQFDAKLRD
jgi:phenylalanyl-tRNA synthetase beta chain